MPEGAPPQQPQQPPPPPNQAAPPAEPTPPAGPQSPPASFSEAVRRLLTPSLLSHLALVAFLLLLVALVNWAALSKGKEKSKRWLCQIDEEMYTDCKEALEVTPTPTPSPTPRTAVANFNATPAESTPAGTGTTAGTGTATGTTGTTSPPSQGTSTATTTPPAGTTSVPTAQDECGQGKLKLTPEQGRRLVEQLAEIKRLVKFHGDVMAYFFSAYYLSISMMLFGGVVAAVALFFIAQNGWGPTNSYVKTVFVVMTAVTAYYGLFPQVFQQNKNITDNMSLFLEYQTLRREVESYPQTCTNVANEQKDPATFITYVNSEMRRLGKIAIGFDYTKIDYKGAFDLSREQTKPPGSVGDTPGNTQNTKNSNGR
jgi:hypothetical protein